MSASQSIPVRVIYDSAQRRSRGTVAYVSRHSHARRLVTLGILNLIVAGSLYYAIWQQVDSFIYLNLFLKTPIVTDMPQADFEAAMAQMFRLPPPEPAERVQPVEDETSSKWSGATTQKVLVGTAYTWLTLATIGYCALALAGGAAFGSGLGPGDLKRAIGVLITLFLLGGLA